MGDLAAVEPGLGINGLSGKQDSRKFRQPDQLANPVQELKKIIREKYQKISGSRAIGFRLGITGNRSRSFQALITGIEGLV